MFGGLEDNDELEVPSFEDEYADPADIADQEWGDLPDYE
jgi:hypothetical protein